MMNSNSTNSFNSYPDINKAEAWEDCQDIYWLLVMLDDSGYSYCVEAHYVLRKYACQIARNYWNSLYLDLRKAIEIVEKSAEDRYFNCGMNKKVRSLIVDKYLARKESKTFAILELAENAIALNIPSAKAAGIVTKHALELGEDCRTLVETLKNLVSNPYLLTPERRVAQNWWIESPKARSIFGCLKQWVNSFKDHRVKYRKEFNCFLSQHSSFREAWEGCPDPNWMLATIDLYSSSDDILRIQSKLRQFACWVARQQFHSLVDECYLDLALFKAEQTAQGKTNLKDLKKSEIETFIVAKRKGTLNDYSTLVVLRCMLQSSWIAAIEVLRFSEESLEFYSGAKNKRKIMHLLQSIKLRELIENPFV